MWNWAALRTRPSSWLLHGRWHACSARVRHANEYVCGVSHRLVRRLAPQARTHTRRDAYASRRGARAAQLHAMRPPNAHSPPPLGRNPSASRVCTPRTNGRWDTRRPFAFMALTRQDCGSSAATRRYNRSRLKSRGGALGGRRGKGGSGGGVVQQPSCTPKTVGQQLPTSGGYAAAHTLCAAQLLLAAALAIGVEDGRGLGDGGTARQQSSCTPSPVGQQLPISGGYVATHAGCAAQLLLLAAISSRLPRVLWDNARK